MSTKSYFFSRLDHFVKLWFYSAMNNLESIIFCGVNISKNIHFISLSFVRKTKLIPVICLRSINLLFDLKTSQVAKISRQRTVFTWKTCIYQLYMLEWNIKSWLTLSLSYQKIVKNAKFFVSFNIHIAIKILY